MEFCQRGFISSILDQFIIVHAALGTVIVQVNTKKHKHVHVGTIIVRIKINNT